MRLSNETIGPQHNNIPLVNKYYKQLLNFIPPDALTVVEAGCTSGYIGTHFKLRNPQCKYIGITEDKEKINTTKNLLDRLIIGIPCTDLLKKNKLLNINSLIIHENILAVSKPGEMIQEISSFVSKNGIILAGFENQQYWRNIKKNTQKPVDFIDNYKSQENPESGFTLDKIRRTVNQTGLIILEIIGIIDTDPECKHILKKTRNQLKQSKISISEYASRIQCSNFIIRAAKSTPEKRMMIQTLMLPPIAACNDKRVLEPVSYLKTIPGVRTNTQEREQVITKVTRDEPRIFIWQRPIMTRSKSLPKLKRLIKSGYLVLVEFDDDPRRWQEIIDNDYLTFTGVHAVQTSTEKLRDFLLNFNPHVKVFPNQIVELGEKKRKKGNNTVHLFFGALNREKDWLPWLKALNFVLSEYDRKIHVTVVHDRGFFDALQTANKSFYSLCNYDQYLQLLSDCDISLLPLEPSEFNLFKSDLKFIECAAHGVVAMASPIVYDQTIKDGITGILVHGENEIFDKLHYLINNPSERFKIANAAYKWVSKNRLLSKHYLDRYIWYKQLIEQLPQLNNELAQRMPELFAG